MWIYGLHLNSTTILQARVYAIKRESVVKVKCLCDKRLVSNNLWIRYYYDFDTIHMSIAHGRRIFSTQNQDIRSP